MYSRFLLSHLGDPGRWVRALAGLLAPGGVLVLEDTHIAGAWCAPPSATFDRVIDIYSRTVRANGGDPDIGPQLPSHLTAAELADVDVQVVQPAALVGDRKRIQRLTLDAVRDNAVAAGVTDHAEVDALLARARRPHRPPGLRHHHGAGGADVGSATALSARLEPVPGVEPTDLLGVWDLARRIVDRRSTAGRRGSAASSAR